ncbi:MAG: PQQ-binding-like beta-propeller repeat protein, partial [Planctomycetota bacterium]|nr:PQQ-binding-like beta-propeller repeat protein [Planctomycetota bacterium]
MKRQIAVANDGQARVHFRIFSALLALLIVCGVGVAEDWPTYRSDVARSGVTSETVGPGLSLRWQYVPTHPPKPAWPMPSEELPRMHIDNAFPVVIAGGNAYFGSCVTNKVTAIDVADGEIRWEFFTEGPVRFAPALYAGKVYVGSDDGNVYCLDGKNGSLVWKYRPGPSDEKVIGNGRMISLWPVRTGILVDDGVAYFTAGIFPYEGLYVCALDAGDGSVVWKNDTIGDRAHAMEFGGISPHGYLLASQDIIYVPSGRSMPAAFDRKTGKFLYSAAPGGKRGGCWALLDNDRLISGVDYSGKPHKVAYDAKTGKRQGDAFAWFPGTDMAVTRESSYILTQDGVYAIDRTAHSQAVRRANKLASDSRKWQSQVDESKKKFASAKGSEQGRLSEQIKELSKKIADAGAEEKRLKATSFKWRYPRKDLRSVLLAGDVVFAGGDRIVIGIDAETGEQVWKSEVDGAAVALAVSDGHLVVSSDKGPIYCFGEAEVAGTRTIKRKVKIDPYPTDSLTETYEAAAEKII